MKRNRRWTTVTNAIENTRLKQWSSIVLLTVGLVVSSGWLPGPAAAAEISPQLREQVLQIIRENPEVILEAV